MDAVAGSTFKADPHIAYRTQGTDEEKPLAMETLLPDQGDVIIQRCEDHMAHAGNNFLPILWRHYKSHRVTLFRLLRTINVQATTQDRVLEETTRFLLDHEHK